MSMRRVLDFLQPGNAIQHLLGHIDEMIIKPFPMVFEAEAFKLLNDCVISCFGIYTSSGSTFALVRQTIAEVL